MGIEISDEELLSMDPDLFLKLQKYLREYRNNKSTTLSEEIKKTDHITLYDYETRTSNQWYFKELNTVFEEVEDKQGKYLGIKITQNDKTYIARNWRINEQIKNIINLASSCNLKCLWRHGHPLDKYFLNEKENDFLKGSHHIGFSEKHAYPWVFVLGSESLRRRHGGQLIKSITFNKKYLNRINKYLIETKNTGSLPDKGEFCLQKFGGKDISILPVDLEGLLRKLSKEPWLKN